MSNHTAAAITAALWTVAGTTDDVTACEHCGRTELKGTVRMIATVDDELVELFAGSSCAAAMTGRPAAAIRSEARTADRAAVAAAAADRDAEFRTRYAAEQAWLDAAGLERSFRTVKLARAALAG